MSEMKRAALTLHGLTDSDREWVLSQLPDAQSGELRTLVDELRALGFPQDLGLEPDPPPAAPKATSAPASTPPVVGKLEQVTPKALYRVLQDESPVLVSTLLEYRGWRWSRGLLRRFKRAQRRLITEQLNGAASSTTKRVQRELLEVVAAALDGQGGQRFDDAGRERFTWQR